ncbi:thioredoxin reductase [hot springs metagenome]|uniref:Thioredoxin reductase n=1 Tax=hot springs metagenome TaxID=433727 RepID=A0A5J4L0V5_9ZZZZ
MNKQFGEMFSEETKKVLMDAFKELKDKVLLEAFVRDDDNDQFSAFTSEFLKGISRLTDKIDIEIYKSSDGVTKKKGITRFPTILINPDKYMVSYIGAPFGEEARTLIMAIILASTNGTIFSDAALKRLFELKEPRHIQIFVSPSCPYCPQQALNAVSAAIAMPDIITVEIIEMYENRDYIDKYHIITVPFTVINDIPIGTGVKPPEIFVEEMHNLSPVERAFAPMAGEAVNVDLAIIGGGPAGLTAAIYAGRSGLKSVVLEKATVGGQVLVTPLVENYPGFSQIAGKTLVDIMYQQALRYTHILEGEDVIDVKRADEVFELKTNRRIYNARGIIIATGAEHKKLDVAGEKSLYGRGVSYCATCDGYFFKDGKKVIVVGGGNTAVTDALYLHSIGAEVSLVHRRDRLRAEAFLQKSLSDNKIPVYWNTVVKEIIGANHVGAVRLQNLKDNSIKVLEVDGVFIAIGYVPNNEIAKILGLRLDSEGYIKVDSRQRTSMHMVYAAGDITGGIKQIVTAVGQGAIAAITAFEDLSNPYWKKGDN